MTALRSSTKDLALLDPDTDRAMLCGSPSMLKETCALLKEYGLEARQGQQGHYVIERAFVES